jgi:hypothetical protein
MKLLTAIYRLFLIMVVVVFITAMYQYNLIVPFINQVVIPAFTFVERLF